MWNTGLVESQAGIKIAGRNINNLRYAYLLLLFSSSVMFGSLWPHGLQNPRLPCLSPSPGVCSNSCPLNWWNPMVRSIELMRSNHLIFCCPLRPLPLIFPRIRVFSNEWAFCIMWPKYWSFSFSISPSKKKKLLVLFRIGCFDLLAVQRTLKSLLQHHNSKASILQPSLWSISHIRKGLLEKPKRWLDGPDHDSSSNPKMKCCILTGLEELPSLHNHIKSTCKPWSSDYKQ